MSDEYVTRQLPLNADLINPLNFFEELIDATAKLEVYREKIRDSKLDSTWFLPTLQTWEAFMSSSLEGTETTFDGVLVNEVAPSPKDRDLNEVKNYTQASKLSYEALKVNDFSHDLFWKIHTALMDGYVRKPKLVGAYRQVQNWIRKRDDSRTVVFTPPPPEEVEKLMSNLIQYINYPDDQLRPLVRTAIIHAQFETIHPFMDGNGRVGRMLIPMYLFFKNQIDLPCFFISEALERDQRKYYTLLNNVRYKDDWDSWIKFFLDTVAKQCTKYIGIVSKINNLYEKHSQLAKTLAKSTSIMDVLNALYRYPAVTAKQVAEETKLPMTTVNRYLALLVENKILYTDPKRSRNRIYFYSDLVDIIRE